MSGGGRGSVNVVVMTRPALHPLWLHRGCCASQRHDSGVRRQAWSHLRHVAVLLQDVHEIPHPKPRARGVC
jgi:hypothetical protein